MKENTSQQSNRLNRNANSILKHPYVKILFVVFLTLIMTIPNMFLRDLIRERESRQYEVTREVTSKWSEGQTLSGPVLVIPYIKFDKYINKKTGKEVVNKYNNTYFILPENLNLNGNINTQTLHRGIYQVPVYNSELSIHSRFQIPDEILSREDIELQKGKAYIAIGINDMRGIEKLPVIKYDNQAVEFESASAFPKLLGSHLRTKEMAIKNSGNEFDVDISLYLKGSSHMYFKPLGKYTEVNLKGNWPSPSFDGSFLPSERNVSEEDFSAKWHVLSHNRTYPQFWNETNFYETHETFGVNLLTPVDHYQKTDRSIKYSLLIIALSFIALYFIELITKRPVSIINYGLIAAALVVYYTLILSIGEHLGFNMAYLIASIATILLITIFAKGLLGSWKPSLTLAGILSAFYTFIFVTLKQEDYALLVGSIGLFVVLAIIMFVSQRIKGLNESV